MTILEKYHSESDFNVHFLSVGQNVLHHISTDLVMGFSLQELLVYFSFFKLLGLLQYFKFIFIELDAKFSILTIIFILQLWKGSGDPADNDAKKGRFCSLYST